MREDRRSLADRPGKRWAKSSGLLWAVILALALGLRLPAIKAAFPYLNYIDEGYLLRPVSRLLDSGGWDPGWYSYPSLPIYAVTAGGYLYTPIYNIIHEDSLRDNLTAASSPYYDLIQPPELLVIGRLATLLASLGIVAFAGLLAGRLAGPAARFWAALVAGILPALVIRGAIVVVDTYAALFVLAALYFTDRAADEKRPMRDSVFAGAMAGLAFTSKYPAGLVLVAVGLGLLVARRAWSVKLRSLTLAAAGAAGAAVVAMPALVLKPGGVVGAWRSELGTYAAKVQGSYWDQAIKRAEWDLPLDAPELGLVYVFLAAAGLALILADPDRSRRVWGWVVYGISVLFVVLQVPFQPFRNLLPLVAVSCVVVGVLITRLRARSPKPWLVDLGAMALLAVFLLTPSIGYARGRWQYSDSRAEAVDWLVENTGAGDTILLVEEMAFMPGELARLEAETMVLPWADALAHLREDAPGYVVVGELNRDPEPLVALQIAPEVAQQYELRARFGDGPTPAGKPGWWRGNRQLVYVLARPGALRDGSLPPFVDFVDIADADWTDETYRHVAIGEQTSVRLRLKAETPRLLRLRHFDHPGKDFDVVVDGELAGSLLGGEQGGGWQVWQVPLPRTAGDEVLVTVLATGSDALGISWIELVYASAVD